MMFKVSSQWSWKKIQFNGCQMCCMGNNSNLLCVNGYTYVMTLIVDKKWKKPLKHFCGVVRRIICYAWMGTHVVVNIDSRQYVKKTIRTFL
jgi:hypothetical protein